MEYRYETFNYKVKSHKELLTITERLGIHGWIVNDIKSEDSIFPKHINITCMREERYVGLYTSIYYVPTSTLMETSKNSNTLEDALKEWNTVMDMETTVDNHKAELKKLGYVIIMTTEKL